MAGRKWSAKFEFEPRDLWLGLYWDLCEEDRWKHHVGERVREYFKGTLHLFICIIPMLPLHITIPREYIRDRCARKNRIRP